MQVVSASRRTDIPAFYSPWLMARLRAGFVKVPNPFNPRRIATVDLTPRSVACLVLWSKDPRPLLPHLGELEERGYRTLFHITLTGLPSALEPGVPPAGEIAGAVRELARRVGPGRVVWRFDPVLLSPLTPAESILRAFSALAGELRGAVRHVVVSFARPYGQVLSRLRRAGASGFLFPDVTEGPAEEALPRVAPLAAALAEIAAEHGLEVFSCAGRLDLAPCGVRAGACIDAALLREEFGLLLPSRKDPGQRAECRCLRSVDIGIYGTCRHRCLYCYARTDAALARGLRHDPLAPLLIGGDGEREDWQS